MGAAGCLTRGTSSTRCFYFGTEVAQTCLKHERGNIPAAGPAHERSRQGSTVLHRPCSSRSCRGDQVLQILLPRPGRPPRTAPTARPGVPRARPSPRPLAAAAPPGGGRAADWPSSPSVSAARQHKPGSCHNSVGLWPHFLRALRVPRPAGTAESRAGTFRSGDGHGSSGESWRCRHRRAVRGAPRDAVHSSVRVTPPPSQRSGEVDTARRGDGRGCRRQRAAGGEPCSSRRHLPCRRGA